MHESYSKCGDHHAIHADTSEHILASVDSYEMRKAAYRCARCSGVSARFSSSTEIRVNAYMRLRVTGAQSMTRLSPRSSLRLPQPNPEVTTSQHSAESAFTNSYRKIVLNCADVTECSSALRFGSAGESKNHTLECEGRHTETKPDLNDHVLTAPFLAALGWRMSCMTCASCIYTASMEHQHRSEGVGT